MSDATDVLDPEANLRDLSHQLERLEQVLDLPPEKLLAKTDVSGWSAGEHVFHMVLACDLSLRNAVSLAQDEGRLVREPEDRQDEAQAILRAGTIPRGVAQAPRFVTPPAKLDLELVGQLLGEVVAARDSVAAIVAALRAAPRTIPHQLLGDLTGVEWVRFARVHTAHHLAIVDEVLAAAG